MQGVVRVTRENWADLVAQAGIRLEVVAALTGKSYSAVYRYKRGDRRAPDEWLDRVSDLLEMRAS